MNTRAIHPSSRLCNIDPSSTLSAAETLPSTTTTSTTSQPSASLTTTIDPQEVVKLFGRLAEKYIMLDPSGGMCTCTSS